MFRVSSQAFLRRRNAQGTCCHGSCLQRLRKKPKASDCATPARYSSTSAQMGWSAGVVAQANPWMTTFSTHSKKNWWVAGQPLPSNGIHHMFPDLSTSGGISVCVLLGNLSSSSCSFYQVLALVTPTSRPITAFMFIPPKPTSQDHSKKELQLVNFKDTVISIAIITSTLYNHIIMVH